MTDYRQNFLHLVQQRDSLYLQLLIASAVGYSWYRLWLFRLFPLAMGLAGLIIGLAVAWGVWQWL